jgi:drug/metabolite transporter (DMT)-like permease
MDLGLLGLTVLFLAAQTLIFKVFNRRYMSDDTSFFAFNALNFAVVVVTYLCIGGPLEKIQASTFFYGMAFGIIFVAIVYCYIKSMETGPLSFSTLALSFGILIPIIYGALFWKERISPIQLLGLVLLLIAFSFFATSAGSDGKRMRRSWFVFVLITFLGNGAGMTILKSHQLLHDGRYGREMLVTAFATAALISLSLFTVGLARKVRIGHLARLPFAALVLGAGITTAFGNQLNVYLNSRLPGIVQFPSVNGGVALISTLASWFLFKERMRVRGMLGLATGLGALILLSIK